MAIQKHALPILEYDDDPGAIIAPDHEKLALALPPLAVYAFLGRTVERYALAHGARQAGKFISISGDFPVYVIEHRAREVCLVQAPLGASAAVQLMDWLMGYGVNTIVTAGSCGVLTDLPENEFLIPARALRDEGTSYHYAPPDRFIDIDPAVRRAIMETLAEHALPSREVTTWTTDGFYRETKALAEYRKSEGCTVVEMECAALAACAALRGARWGQLLYTADSLANAERYSERGWGADSMDIALSLCLGAVVKL